MEKQDRKWMINQAYNDLVKQIRRDLKDEILDDIKKRTEQMKKVLENGRPIYENSIGIRFSRIHDARMNVWNKINILDQMWVTILERY